MSEPFRLFPEMTALIRQFWKCLKLSGFCQKWLLWSNSFGNAWNCQAFLGNDCWDQTGLEMSEPFRLFPEMTSLIRQFWKCLKLSSFSRKRLFWSDSYGNVRTFQAFPGNDCFDQTVLKMSETFRIFTETTECFDQTVLELPETFMHFLIIINQLIKIVFVWRTFIHILSAWHVAKL